MAKITFIGGGNMASAIIGGLVANGTQAARITVVDPSPEQRAALTERYEIATTEDAAAGCAEAETIILATKPQIISAVAEQVAGKLDLSEKLLISIAAGTTIATLEALFGPIAIVRTMPNTPALFGLSATGVFFNDKVSPSQQEATVAIVEAFGISVPVADEALLDAVTAVSGSGPAYFFLLIEEMAKSGAALGLDPEVAQTLAIRTALGAASMAAEGDTSPEQLRRNVTSPNGTTHAAITSFQGAGFGEIVHQAMTACRDRAVELGKG